MLDKTRRRGKERAAFFSLSLARVSHSPSRDEERVYSDHLRHFLFIYNFSTTRRIEHVTRLKCQSERRVDPRKILDSVRNTVVDR